MLARRIIAKHVTKTTVLAMLGATAVLSGLQVLFTYLGELGALKDGYGAWDAFLYVLWGAPKALYEILPISATEKINTELILPKLKSMLPINPPYYDKDQITDKPERFFVNETVREKILLNYEKEIPYSVEVVTEQFKEKDNAIVIDAVIYVERDSQKGIVIGHKGEMIKKVGTEARIDLEKFFDKKIHLSLFVKVKKDWRKNDRDLKNFGYS